MILVYEPLKKRKIVLKHQALPYLNVHLPFISLKGNEMKVVSFPTSLLKLIVSLSTFVMRLTAAKPIVDS